MFSTLAGCCLLNSSLGLSYVLNLSTRFHQISSFTRSKSPGIIPTQVAAIFKPLLTGSRLSILLRIFFLFINTGELLMSGDFVKAHVTGSLEYDLIGEIADEYTE